MVHIKEPLMLIGKSNPCDGSRFRLSLSEWYCVRAYVCSYIYIYMYVCVCARVCVCVCVHACVRACVW